MMTSTASRTSDASFPGARPLWHPSGGTAAALLRILLI